MKVHPFTAEDHEAWDRFVAESHNGTFLHSRRFLSYHGSRFADRSLLIRGAGGELVGVLPAALDPADAAEVVSHPGATYGGLVRDRRLSGEGVVRAFEEILDAFRRGGLRRFVYKPVPQVFHVVPSDDDLYALFRLGAARVRCDLSVAIDLPRRARAAARPRAAELAKARNTGVIVERGVHHLERFWAVLGESLAERHGVAPLHSLEEIRELIGRFPAEIELVVGRAGTDVVAGAIVFKTRAATHTQYLATNAQGRGTAALDLVIETCIADAASAGSAYFSFGVSTEQQGRVLNQGLHAFKVDFGGGGVAHETYAIDL